MDYIPEISSESLRKIFHKGLLKDFVIIFKKYLLGLCPGSGHTFIPNGKIGANRNADVLLVMMHP